MRGTDLYGPGIGFLGLGDRNDERNDALNNFSDLLFFLVKKKVIESLNDFPL